MERNGKNMESIAMENRWQKKFQFPPEEITQFEEGDNITRENFMGAIVKSHMESQDGAKAQAAYILYQGNEFIDAIKGCVDSGGWESLSESEKEYYVSSYNEIPEHGDLLDSNHVENGNSFNLNLHYMLSIIDEEKLGSKDELIDKYSNYTWKEFKEHMHELIEEERKTKREYQSLRDDFL